MLSVASLQPPGNGKLFEITEVLGIETLTSEIDSTQYYGLCVVFVVCGKIAKFSTCQINNDKIGKKWYVRWRDAPEGNE